MQLMATLYVYMCVLLMMPGDCCMSMYDVPCALYTHMNVHDSGAPVHVVSPMHVGSAVHVGAAVHAVHVDSAERRGADGNNAMA